MANHIFVKVGYVQLRIVTKCRMAHCYCYRSGGYASVLCIHIVHATFASCNLTRWHLWGPGTAIAYCTPSSQSICSPHNSGTATIMTSSFDINLFVLYCLKIAVLKVRSAYLYVGYPCERCTWVSNYLMFDLPFCLCVLWLLGVHKFVYTCMPLACYALYIYHCMVLGF